MWAAISRKFARKLLPLAGIACVCGAWELVARVEIRNEALFAPFSTTVAALWRLVVSGAISNDVRVSAEEFIIGYAVAAIIGLALGALLAARPFLSDMFGGVIQAGYATPLIAVAPLLIVLFGLGLMSKIVIVGILVIFPILVNTESAFKGIDPEYAETCRAYGWSKTRAFTTIYVRAAAPGIITGLRLGVGRGIIGVVVGELVGASAGLGFLTLNYSQAFETANALAIVVILTVIGVVANSLLLWIAKRANPWKVGRRSR